MKFSLIIGTLNRRKEIECCLESLLDQNYNDYEIIIVDQSENKDTELYISELNNPRIKYVHVQYKNLSKARNDGILMSSGDYICLVDDDAHYDKTYLEIASQNVKNNIILSGKIHDTISNKPYVKYKESKNNRNLNQRDIIRTCPSAALIIPYELFKKIGGFDENFGIGSLYGSGEETDVLLRAIYNGYHVMYLKDLILFHPYPVPCKTSTNIEKSMLKRAKHLEGLGALIKKHRTEYKNRIIMETYYETKIKLFIKYILKKSIRGAIRKQIDGFNKGYDNYRMMRKNNES